jgi:AbrB family looped-hinge helix DNA binding protein
MTQAYQDIIKIQPKGVITIPKKLREKVGLAEATLAKITKDKGRLIIEPVETLDYPVRRYTKAEVDSFIKLDKRLTKRLRKKSPL